MTETCEVFSSKRLTKSLRFSFAHVPDRQTALLLPFSNLLSKSGRKGKPRLWEGQAASAPGWWASLAGWPCDTSAGGWQHAWEWPRSKHFRLASCRQKQNKTWKSVKLPQHPMWFNLHHPWLAGQVVRDERHCSSKTAEVWETLL